MASPPRLQLFISHAYPEDNVFADWLAQRLRVEGYEPWIDLRVLKGGERIWPEVERAVRESSFRFLYILSATSNAKDGTLQELELARKVSDLEKIPDFVVPLVIDGLRASDFNIRLTQLRPIGFSASWAAGLGELLEKLASVKAPQSSSPEIAATSWRARVSGTERIRNRSEALYSNLLPILHVPERMFAFSAPAGVDSRDISSASLQPLILSGRHLYSYEPNPSLLHPALVGTEPTAIATAATRPKDDVARSHFDARLALIRRAWELGLARMGLRVQEMANQRQCLYFPAGLAPDRVPFVAQALSSWRSLTGISRGAYWHYGVSAHLRQFEGLHLALAAHVVFTDDGCTPWPSSELQHKARRRIGRTWWNDKWRDLLLAAASWLARGSKTIVIDVGGGERLEVGALPAILDAPFHFEHSPQPIDDEADAVGGDLDHEDPEDPDDEIGPAEA